MTTLLERIEEDFKQALRAHRKDEARVLRLIKTELQYATIEKRTALTDDEILRVLEKMVKKRREAIELFKKADRPDHIQNEEEEIRVIERYLPRALSDEEILPIVEEVIQATGAEGPNDLGRVMGMVMQRLKGQRVDGRRVKELVETRLKRGDRT